MYKDMTNGTKRPVMLKKVLEPSEIPYISGEQRNYPKECKSSIGRLIGYSFYYGIEDGCLYDSEPALVLPMERLWKCDTN